MEISTGFISSVTDAAMEDITAWQSRPIEPIYPVVFFDPLRVKMREDAVVRNKAIYLALSVLSDGRCDILGLWLERTDGAKFWMNVSNGRKISRVGYILIAANNGSERHARGAGCGVYPATTLQTCIVHQIRDSLDYATWEE